MNERIQKLAEQAGLKYYNWINNVSNINDGNFTYPRLEDYEKFAELIVRECMKELWDEIVSDEDIAQEDDPLIREYLKGNNQGIVDAVIRFRNHFGVQE